MNIKRIDLNSDQIKGHIGNHIRHYREKNFISIEELAEAIGMNAKHLGDVERGKHNTASESLFKIYLALEIQQDFWYGVKKSIQVEDQ